MTHFERMKSEWTKEDFAKFFACIFFEGFLTAMNGEYAGAITKEEVLELMNETDDSKNAVAGYLRWLDEEETK